jgi:glycosyltransferase involved in cell wall biosynthesis
MFKGRILNPLCLSYTKSSFAFEEWFDMAARVIHPAVGVIIPVRNGARTLAAAIRSVIDQRPAPIDIVVIDGDSDDGSGALAATFPGVRVIAQAGRGFAAARNQGLRAVTGEAIAFCDSDDCWTGGALATRLNHLAAEPGCNAVIGLVEKVLIDGDGATPQQASQLGRITPGYTPGALMARREAFDTVGPFDETLAIGADSDWFMRLAQSDVRLDVLPVLVLRKGVRSSSLSADITTYRRELLLVARRFLDRRRQNES